MPLTDYSIEEFREFWRSRPDLGVYSARNIFFKNRALKQVEAATTIADLKPILIDLINQGDFTNASF